MRRTCIDHRPFRNVRKLPIRVHGLFAEIMLGLNRKFWPNSSVYVLCPQIFMYLWASSTLVQQAALTYTGSACFNNIFYSFSCSSGTSQLCRIFWLELLLFDSEWSYDSNLMIRSWRCHFLISININACWLVKYGSWSFFGRSGLLEFRPEEKLNVK